MSRHDVAAPHVGQRTPRFGDDDDAVPEIDDKSAQQIVKEARQLKKRLDNEGVVPEMVAPRLWFSPMTIDGAYTSNDPKCSVRLPSPCEYPPTTNSAL